MYFSSLKNTKLIHSLIKNKIISSVIKRRIENIRHTIKSPHKTQEKVFRNLIKKGRQSVFGKKYKFNNITSYQDFTESVPINTYEDLYPYIKRIMCGEMNILWPGKTKWFAKSSGTTNSDSKYIPITQEALYKCHYKGGKDMLSLYANNFPTRNLYNGKGLMLGGSFKYNKYNIQEGDLSAILINKFPFWVNMHRVPDKKTATMSDWEIKLEKIANQAIKENITNLTGVPSWMLILLQRVLSKTNKKNILEVWPNLELYMHGGINFTPYKERFQELIPSEKMNYLEGYNASEGFFAIQDKHMSSDMMLMLDYGVFFEFIKIEKYRKGEMRTINLSDVELNKDYVVVISTNSGLWRYIIGDVIRFTSISPFRVNITGRTKNYINVFGEELMIHNTDNAIINTCKKLNCSIKDYTVAPVFINNQSGRHQWLIEFNNAPQNMSLFAKLLDDNLKFLNSDYKAKREKSLVISKPEIISIKNNEFYNWLSKNNRTGGQFKIPRLNNDRAIINDILSSK